MFQLTKERAKEGKIGLARGQQRRHHRQHARSAQCNKVVAINRKLQETIAPGGAGGGAQKQQESVLYPVSGSARREPASAKGTTGRLPQDTCARLPVRAIQCGRYAAALAASPSPHSAPCCNRAPIVKTGTGLEWLMSPVSSHRHMKVSISSLTRSCARTPRIGLECEVSPVIAHSEAGKEREGDEGGCESPLAVLRFARIEMLSL
ncbi:hypothetical protein HPB51_024668 [Rhipicephalus microplus]|uniref:Uncharacterized protein n=1 Tax=Rhipicephalus microplus TaxID=6941 RepID=A0A9J6DRH7_RHIMP|nr:hypothetical protein HPB51_024668 [Rhipicephalus microplus]